MLKPLIIASIKNDDADDFLAARSMFIELDLELSKQILNMHSLQDVTVVKENVDNPPLFSTKVIDVTSRTVGKINYPVYLSEMKDTACDVEFCDLVVTQKEFYWVMKNPCDEEFSISAKFPVSVIGEIPQNHVMFSSYTNKSDKSAVIFHRRSE